MTDAIHDSRSLPRGGGYSTLTWSERNPAASAERSESRNPEPIKVALLSFLFNWPSTGGGIVHTVELARFLERAGYSVQLFHPRYPAWGLGRCEPDCPFPATPLAFSEVDWTLPTIQARFRAAVDAFDPDAVLITDSWNFKPWLAAAVADYPYFLRMQALECLCPLNNLRLLADSAGGFQQCATDQLRAPAECRRCLARNGAFSGSLHQAERTLSGVGTPEYGAQLGRAFREAEAVLALNPEAAEMLRPHAGRVEVVTWGMDPERFPPPTPPPPRDGLTRLLFAGLVDEAIKGFSVVQSACARLWQTRRDFELVVTGDPTGRGNAFTRFVGWQSQEQLPRLYRETDVCLVPTIAQDGLSRTAVEAMASARPVIGSRLGGVPFAVRDGQTGFLCPPGDVGAWAEQIARLLDDPQLRMRMGQAGRQEFERRFTWDGVIARDYRRLLVRRDRTVRSSQTALGADRSSGNAVSPSPAESRITAITAAAPRPLRILFLANFSGRWTNPTHVADVLDELGHAVTKRHEFAVPSAEHLIAELDSGRYDCLLFSKGRLGARTLDDILRPDGAGIAHVLRATRIPAYMWYVDKVDLEPSREPWMRKVAPLCRVAFVTDGRLAEAPWARFRILRQGVLRHTVQKRAVSERERRDVAFLGSLYGARAQELEPVLRRFDVTQVTNVFGPDLSRVVRGHRIVLGPWFPGTDGYWSDRIYVVLGHGGFFLGPEFPGMREEGLIPGEHYAALGPDLVRDIEDWLARPDERERIAHAGQALVLQRFTYRERLKELCRVIEETLP